MIFPAWLLGRENKEDVTPMETTQAKESKEEPTIITEDVKKYGLVAGIVLIIVYILRG